MITEDYVSYEVAKLLKEKGFDETCYACYEYFSSGITMYSGWLFEYKGEVVHNSEDKIKCPTLQMAIKWLREVHKIFIEVYTDKAYNAKDIIFNPEVWDKNLNSIWRAGCFTTYEKACEAAIKYCLENLI